MKHLNINMLLDSLNGAVMVKDTNSRYVACNNVLANLAGLSSPDEVKGKTDFDLPWSQNADCIIEMDKKVFNSNDNVTYIEPMKIHNGHQIIFYTRKNPMHDSDGNIVSLLAQALVISAPDCIKSLNIISSKDSLIFGSLQSSYRIKDVFFNVSESESLCLFYLMRGMTYSEIANALYISSRTVESHINNMKQRLGCSTKSQLIEKAIANGFLYVIPRKLLEANSLPIEHF